MARFGEDVDPQTEWGEEESGRDEWNEENHWVDDTWVRRQPVEQDEAHFGHEDFVPTTAGSTHAATSQLLSDAYPNKNLAALKFYTLKSTGQTFLWNGQTTSQSTREAARG